MQIAVAVLRVEKNCRFQTPVNKQLMWQTKISSMHEKSNIWNKMLKKVCAKYVQASVRSFHPWRTLAYAYFVHYSKNYSDTHAQKNGTCFHFPCSLICALSGRTQFGAALRAASDAFLQNWINDGQYLISKQARSKILQKNHWYSFDLWPVKSCFLNKSKLITKNPERRHDTDERPSPAVTRHEGSLNNRTKYRVSSWYYYSKKIIRRKRGILPVCLKSIKSAKKASTIAFHYRGQSIVIFLNPDLER